MLQDATPLQQLRAVRGALLPAWVPTRDMTGRRIAAARVGTNLIEHVFIGSAFAASDVVGFPESAMVERRKNATGDIFDVNIVSNGPFLAVKDDWLSTEDRGHGCGNKSLADEGVLVFAKCIGRSNGDDG